MSTSTNLQKSSPPYHGPSGGAVATLSQPNSNAFVSPMNEALQKAIQKYQRELSEDDKVAFQSAPNIMERLQEMEGNGKPLISSSLATRVEKVLQCINKFMGSLGIFIQHSPEISSLVVGGLNCILMVGTCSIFYSRTAELIYY